MIILSYSPGHCSLWRRCPKAARAFTKTSNCDCAGMNDNVDGDWGGDSASNET